ncbi:MULTISPECIES: group I truncated hemoglobin [Alteromonas]|uniref:group I truncated hemoglobin n=1 Tax=Alteromonas TaxID=226 RepID=UPI0018E73373|nr:group 1 truncated hemoglobin [Alteromonas sp. IB21]MEC7360719.1 group 1 truncated hemoglobin [Pseudomonadota bacterium]MEC8376511.1 group 1 truncated hemoglobin [Pseudomonadota bacterium]
MSSFLRTITATLIAFVVLGCTSTPKQSLYDEIGGHQTLNTIYGVAITRIYTDPVIGHYFKGVPKKHLRDQLVLQTCELIGGPCEYDGKSMIESHKGLGIKEREFYILVEYVQGAMRDVGLTYQQENRILKQLAPIKYETIYL